MCASSHTSVHNFGVSWGERLGTGLVSVEYTFKGESAHAALNPWRGRSALDAVELMDVGWNFRREHLRLQQRSHYVITNGGDQPNVVPSNASVWYYFREIDYPHIKELREIGARRQLLSPVATTISAGDGQQGVSPTTWRHSVIVVGRLVAVEHISAGAPSGA